jgi:hypothetical protein
MSSLRDSKQRPHIPPNADAVGLQRCRPDGARRGVDDVVQILEIVVQILEIVLEILEIFLKVLEIVVQILEIFLEILEIVFQILEIFLEILEIFLKILEIFLEILEIFLKILEIVVQTLEVDDRLSAIDAADLGTMVPLEALNFRALIVVHSHVSPCSTSSMMNAVFLASSAGRTRPISCIWGCMRCSIGGRSRLGSPR